VSVSCRAELTAIDDALSTTGADPLPRVSPIMDDTPTPAPRRGATRPADVPPAVLAALNAGTAETLTLAEALAIDFAALLRAVAPEVGDAAVAEMEALRGSGITRRMAAAGALLLARFDLEEALARFAAHPSDTVRGWAAYAAGAAPGLPLAERLARVRPLADDPHFGVREWAWLALRPHIAAEPTPAIGLLAAWTAEPSVRLRRFAAEAIRPRGVWAAHIGFLKRDPAAGLPVLEPLRADPEPYVQDSVANWLNDAAKSTPGWVRDLCARWAVESPHPATDRIRRRALRNIG
jgi:3-methyladenine DNA glycosylase AlkC